MPKLNRTIDPDTKDNIVFSIAIGLGLCLPLTGFIFGFVNCDGCENSFNGILTRMFIGLVSSITTISTFGKPWLNAAGHEAVNLRGYAILAFFLISIIIFVYKDRKKTSKENESLIDTPFK